MLEHFWLRWTKDYLLSLREYTTSHKAKGSQQPSINDIVIIYDEKQPRQRWRLGKIIELVKSKDKNIRSAKVLIGRTKMLLRDQSIACIQ